MRAARAIASAILAAAAGGVALPGDTPPQLAKARVEVRDGASGLARVFASEAAGHSPHWIGYAVPSGEGRNLCCGGGNGQGSSWGSNERCTLESNEWSGTMSVPHSREAVLDEGARMFLFYRVERGRILRIRAFSDECTIDGTGASVVWLTNVRPAESVSLLSGIVSDLQSSDRDERRPVDRAIMAVAMHDDPAADVALERFASAGSPERLRKTSIFWLGNARGERGYLVLKRLALASEEGSDAVRKSVTFALSQSPVPAATETLIAMAKGDASPHVRGQALFWLAQKAGKRAAETIQDAIRDDPEVEVKKKAVFALTQLPSDESVTHLIRLARTNRSPEVRKQALFWLGQSKDPRALSFIEEILTKN